MRFKFLRAFLVSIFDISVLLRFIIFLKTFISEGLFANDKAKFETPSLDAKFIHLKSFSVKVFNFTLFSK